MILCLIVDRQPHEPAKKRVAANLLRQLWVAANRVEDLKQRRSHQLSSAIQAHPLSATIALNRLLSRLMLSFTSLWMARSERSLGANHRVETTQTAPLASHPIRASSPSQALDHDEIIPITPAES